MTELPPRLLALLRRPSPCFIATTMPDGSPQLTQTWVDTDGENILINTVVGFRKVKNVDRDPRVALSVADPDDVSDYFSIKGVVTGTSTDGAAEHIDLLSHRYIGEPYPWFGGRDQQRIVLTIRVDAIPHSPWG